MSDGHASPQFFSFVVKSHAAYPDTRQIGTRQEIAVMSSYSRNTRRANSPLRPRALGAGLALSLMSGAVLADGAHQFVFTAYSDAAGGAEVVEGRYRAALEELQSRPRDMDFDPSTTNTNRCVAYS